MDAPLVGELVVDEIASVSQAEGLAAGLHRIIDRGLPVPCSGAGRTLVPAGAAGKVAAWHVAGAELSPGQAEVRVVPHPLAGTEGLELIEVAGPTGAGRPVSDSLQVGVLLVAARLGLVAAMLDLAVHHLRDRQAEGRPLINKQLPQQAIAEAATTAELCRYAVLTARSSPAIDDVHTRLSTTGWALTVLFGGAGYLRDHPARCLYVAELVRDAWVTPAPVEHEEHGCGLREGGWVGGAARPRR